MRNYFFFIILMSLWGCDNSLKETPSGLKYTLIRDGVGEPLKNRERVVVNMSYRDENDSVWYRSDALNPVVIKKPASVGYSRPRIQHVFYDLKLGDSITFETTVGDFFRKSFGNPIPPNSSEDQKLIVNAGVELLLDDSNFERWKSSIIEKRQVIIDSIANQVIIEDMQTIKAYLDSIGLDAMTREEGFSYVINEEGNGPYPITNDIVSVNYTGRILSGNYFDSNIKEMALELGLYDTLREPYEPIQFVVGRRDVIEGWDKSIRFLKEGSKATLYISSPLGYGPAGRGDVIPPNSILVFDIELLTVTQR